MNEVREMSSLEDSKMVGRAKRGFMYCCAAEEEGGAGSGFYGS
jgi:hypothetical protein